MIIKLSPTYYASVDTTQLGYVGEHLSRTITLSNYQVDGADSYKLQFDYSDGVSYQVDITDGTYTVDASIMRVAGEVQAQVLACKLVNDTYAYVRKSNVFTLRIAECLSGQPAPVPTYEQAVSALDEILSEIGKAEQSAEQAVQSATEAQQSATEANQALVDTEQARDVAVSAVSRLQPVIDSANIAKDELLVGITDASTAKSNLDTAVTDANRVLPSLVAENVSATANIEELQSENFDSQEILTGVADLRAYLGLTNDDTVGVQVNYKNKTFTRLAGATNLTGGADFDTFTMYGGRKRCNVADDGTINAYYGDEGYTEDGSNGQVMVYQPKFYYLVCPVVYDPIETGIGYHLRKANNYVSAGFSVANAGGFISAIGYAPECDWMFIGSEVLGNSSVPVGDYQWTTENLNGYRIARLGGRWDIASAAGAFCWALGSGVGDRGRSIGGRLVYVPTATV